MRIGLIDVDGPNFPNIPLMQLSAWHKSIGDSVEWYSPLFSGHVDWKDLLQQLIDSKAKVNINQGIDIRIMTDEKAEMIRQLRVDSVHFAWDRYEDKELIVPKFKMFKDITGWKARKTSVFVLTNFDTTIEQDLERIYTLRDMDYDPYVMVYDKQHTKGGDTVRLLQRYVNNRKIFKTIKRFEDYNPRMG